MTKKDYQAIARAIHETTGERCSAPIPLTFDRCMRLFTKLSGGTTGCPVHGLRESISRDPLDMRDNLIRALADVLAADNPRFDRARFVEACETGRTKGMPR